MVCVFCRHKFQLFHQFSENSDSLANFRNLPAKKVHKDKSKEIQPLALMSHFIHSLKKSLGSYCLLSLRISWSMIYYEPCSFITDMLHTLASSQELRYFLSFDSRDCEPTLVCKTVFDMQLWFSAWVTLSDQPSYQQHVRPSGISSLKFLKVLYSFILLYTESLKLSGQL